MLNRFYAWLETRVDPFPPSEAQKPPDRLAAFMWFYSKPFIPLLIMASVMAVLVALTEIFLYGFIGGLVDKLQASSRQNFWQEHGTEFLLVGLLVAVQPLMALLDDGISHQGMRGNYSMRIRWLAHRYVLRQSMAFFQNDFAGRISTKVMQAALAVRDIAMRFIDISMYVTIYVLGALALLASADLRLMLPLLAWLLGYVLACRHFLPILEKQSSEQADMRSLVTGRVVDSYTNIATVKLFAHTEGEDAYAKEGMGWMLNSVYASMRTATDLGVTLSLLNAALFLTISSVSIWLWYIGTITTGAIATALALVLRLRAMSQWIIWEVAGLFEDIGTARDSMKTIARERSISDKPGAPALALTKGLVEFRNVSFNYGKTASDERKALNDLSLIVKPGEKVGIVGRSGAGKSTLANLLLRFYEVESGAILIDGQNIADVGQESLRSAIGVVTQDTSLLHRSVLDNLRYGKTGASMEEVNLAVSRAHADGFISGLVDLNGRSGYQAHVGERGVKLSGGQRQRIAIARVLLKNAPILILDEATSALDSEVEAAIQENLYALMEGKTVIAVAHRLSTIAAMDRLVVLDKGRILEQGSHKQLLRKNGLYASLWKRQSGGFLVDETFSAVAE